MLETIFNIIRHLGMQIRAKIRYYFTPIKMAHKRGLHHWSAGEDVEHLELSYSPVGGWKWGPPLRKTAWQFLKMLERGIPCDPDILCVGICPREAKAHVFTKTWTWTFTAALFLIAQTAHCAVVHYSSEDKLTVGHPQAEILLSRRKK